MHNIILLPKSIFKRTQNVYGQNKECVFSMFFVETLCWGCGGSGSAACVHASAGVMWPEALWPLLQWWGQHELNLLLWRVCKTSQDTWQATISQHLTSISITSLFSPSDKSRDHTCSAILIVEYAYVGLYKCGMLHNHGTRTFASFSLQAFLNVSWQNSVKK